MYFADKFNLLRFIYRLYSYTAALKQDAPDIKIVHFLGTQRPWQAQHYGGGSGGGSAYVVDYLRKWQDIYKRHVQSKLPSSLVR